MNKGLNDKIFIFGILKSDKRAISINKFRKVTDENTNVVCITHDDGNRTNIIVANIKIVYNDYKGNFMAIPNGNIAFEVPENFEDINEENAYELANRFLNSQEINPDKKMHYLGSIN